MSRKNRPKRRYLPTKMPQSQCTRLSGHGLIPRGISPAWLTHFLESVCKLLSEDIDEVRGFYPRFNARGS
jgi:hypothetical protein